MHTLHIVPHTHWDREWYQTFQQFRLKLVHLIDGLFELFDSESDFNYFMLDGQTIVLEDYLQMRPERLDDLRGLIRSGRITIGPWYILPDEFLVSPEAHIRNLLEGDRTTRQFGAEKMPVGYLPDTFGHIGQMPQILKGFGFDTACLWRGLADEPTEILWSAPDGSRVLLAYLRDSYSNGASLPVENLPLFVEILATQGKSLASASAITDHLIMLGTDHMEPPRSAADGGLPAAIAYANRALAENELFDACVRHSTLPEFTRVVRTALAASDIEIPTVTGELRDCQRSHLLPGVLSTRMWIKQRNRASETLLEKWVEPFTTFAELVTRSSAPTLGSKPSSTLQQPASITRQAWRLLMENHPHDSICGCGIDQVHDEMKIRFDQVDQIGEKLTIQSLETLASAVNTNPSTDTAAGQLISAIVVFNPTSVARSDLTSVELAIPPEVVEFELINAAGQSIPYESSGLGRREIASVLLNRNEMRQALASIHDGLIMDLAISAVNLQREGDTAHIEVILGAVVPDVIAREAGLMQFQALIDDPTIIKYQVLARTADTSRVAFIADQAPGLGWRTYYVRSKTVAASTAQSLPALARPLMPLATRLASTSLGKAAITRLARDPADKPPYRISNEFLTVEVAQDGTLTVHHQQSGVTFVGLNRFVDGGDAGDEYNYAPPEGDDPQAIARLVRSSVHRGPVQQTLEVTHELMTPTELAQNRKSRAHDKARVSIVSRISLAMGLPRLDVQTEIENTARDHRLRVHFPTPFRAESAQHDGHFEIVNRPVRAALLDGRDFSRATWVEDPRPEVPQRTFSSVAANGAGLMIANRGLPEVEVRQTEAGSEIALTLLRCVGWLSRDDFSTRRGHAGPQLPTPGAQMPGRWTFDYSIIPFSKPEEDTPPFHQAYAFEAPLRAVSTALHPGLLPASGSFIEVEPAEFVISAVKQAENGKGWLVRGYNLTGKTIDVRLRPWRIFKHAALVNLAEVKQANLSPAADGSLNISARGHEVVTVWFGA